MRNYDSSWAGITPNAPSLSKLPAVVAAIKQPTEAKGIKSDCLSKYMGSLGE